MTITAAKLKALSGEGAEGELFMDSQTMRASRDNSDGGFMHRRLARFEKAEDGFVICKIVNAYRTRQLVHVDEVEKLVKGMGTGKQRWINRADLLPAISALGDQP